MLGHFKSERVGAQVRHLAEKIHGPGAQFQVLPRTGHMPQIERILQRSQIVGRVRG